MLRGEHVLLDQVSPRLCVCMWMWCVLVWAHAWIYVSVEVRGHVFKTQSLSLGWNSQRRLGWMATLSQYWDDK